MRLPRIGKRIVVIFVVALAILTGGYYYAVTPHHGTADPESADGLIERANTLSWNNRWAEARPLYRRAEILFAAKRDTSKALFASVSQIPPDESIDIPAAIWSLTADLAQPGASDAETRLRILTVRGILQTNQDAAQARAPWD